MGIRIQQHESVTFDCADAEITVPSATVISLVLDRVRRGAEPKPAASAVDADSFAASLGGKHIGTTLHEGRPHALILLPGEFQGNWKDACDWAEKQGGVLPSRIDALVLLKHAKDEFKPEWYWLDEQPAAGNDFAWMQSFTDGGQDDIRKVITCRVRAVRRVPI
jgi:hypothetical protein